MVVLTHLHPGLTRSLTAVKCLHFSCGGCMLMRDHTHLLYCSHVLCCVPEFVYSVLAPGTQTTVARTTLRLSRNTRERIPIFVHASRSLAAVPFPRFPTFAFNVV